MQKIFNHPLFNTIVVINYVVSAGILFWVVNTSHFKGLFGG